MRYVRYVGFAVGAIVTAAIGMITVATFDFFKQVGTVPYDD